jgi:hypothetical protein
MRLALIISLALGGLGALGGDAAMTRADFCGVTEVKVIREVPTANVGLRLKLTLDLGGDGRVDL